MGFFENFGKAIDCTIRKLDTYLTVDKQYEGKILIGHNIRRFQNWHGPTIRRTLPFQTLPSHYKKRKVKMWVALTDDEDTTYGAIFYKNKRKH